MGRRRRRRRGRWKREDEAQPRERMEPASGAGGSWHRDPSPSNRPTIGGVVRLACDWLPPKSAIAGGPRPGSCTGGCLAFPGNFTTLGRQRPAFFRVGARRVPRRGYHARQGRSSSPTRTRLGPRCLGVERPERSPRTERLVGLALGAGWALGRLLPSRDLGQTWVL